ncbi:hypothetical protein M1589_03795 [Candidatus Marsarchaeota archaeon]|nr:hypothetical protein [Candidatus Marsarchaeota archaeon]
MSAPKSVERALGWKVHTDFKSEVGYTTHYDGCSGGGGSTTFWMHELLFQQFTPALRQAVIMRLKEAGKRSGTIRSNDIDSRGVVIISPIALSRDAMKLSVVEASETFVAGIKKAVGPVLSNPEITEHGGYVSVNVKKIPVQVREALVAHMGKEISSGRGSSALMEEYNMPGWIGNVPSVAVTLNPEDSIMKIGQPHWEYSVGRDFARKLLYNAARSVIADSSEFARQLKFGPYSPLRGVKPPETREEVLALLSRKRAEATGSKASVTKLERRAKTIGKAQEDVARRLERTEAEQEALERFLPQRA